MRSSERRFLRGGGAATRTVDKQREAAFLDERILSTAS